MPQAAKRGLQEQLGKLQGQVSSASIDQLLAEILSVGQYDELHEEFNSQQTQLSEANVLAEQNADQLHVAALDSSM